MSVKRITDDLTAAGLRDKAEDFYKAAAQVELADQGKIKGSEAKAAKKALSALLDDYPALYRLWGDLQANIVYKIATDMAGEKASVRQAIYEAAYYAKLDDFGHSEASAIERLLIENIALCWLRYLWVEHRYEDSWTADRRTLDQGIYWERLLNAAQSRYLRAVGQLARVRKLATATPAVLQVVTLPTIATNGNGHHNGHFDKVITAETV